MTDPDPARASRRENPLCDGNTAHRYVAEGRDETQALTLARGADVGVFFANAVAKVFELQAWITSRRNSAWLTDAGGDRVADWMHALRARTSEPGAPAVPAGGFTTLMGEVLELAQRVYVISRDVTSRLDDEHVRGLGDACRNELSMMALFATRAALSAGIETPTATELAALAVWTGVEPETGRMYGGDAARQIEEKARRVDKFRKIIDNLDVTASKFDELTSLG